MRDMMDFNTPPLDTYESFRWNARNGLTGARQGDSSAGLRVGSASEGGSLDKLLSASAGEFLSFFFFYFEAAAAVAGWVSKLFSWSQPSLGFNFFLQLFAVPELAFSSLIYVPAAHPPRSAQRATTDGATTTTQRTTAPGLPEQGAPRTE